MRKIISFGKIDYNGTGRKINEVTVDISLRDVGDYGRTIDLEDVKRYKKFSVMATVWNARKTDCIACGQILDELIEFPQLRNNKRFMEIYELWKRWHLNDLHAGTRRQEMALRQAGLLYADYSVKVDYLKSIDLYEDDGYRYGADWLIEIIPQDVEERIQKVMESDVYIYHKPNIQK